MAKKKRPEFSEAFRATTQRQCAGYAVPEDVTKLIREMITAKQRANKPHTDPGDVNRAAIRLFARDQMMEMGSWSGVDGDGDPIYDAPVEQGRELHILLGLPASGKSTIADSLSKITKARIMDSDMVKEMIPEYDEGFGAEAVHEESGVVIDSCLDEAMANGDNLILSKTTTDPEKLADTIRAAQEDGYKIYLHAIDLNPNKAMGRMMERYRLTGRFISPEIARSKMGPDGENLILHAFAKVANDPELCAGWTLWSNDVKFGEKSVLLGRSKTDDPVIDKLTEGADTDRSHIIGVEPETDEQARKAVNGIYDAIDRDNVKNIEYANALKNPARRAELKNVHGQGSDTERLNKILAQMDVGLMDRPGTDAPETPGE